MLDGEAARAIEQPARAWFVLRGIAKRFPALFGTDVAMSPLQRESMGGLGKVITSTSLASSLSEI